MDVANAVDELISIAKTSTLAPAIRTAAVEGLGYAGGAKARSVLLEIAKTSTLSPEIRAAAARSLGRACIS